MENDLKIERPIKKSHMCFYCYSFWAAILLIPIAISTIFGDSLRNYIVASIIFLILIIIGALIFYAERRSSLLDISKIKTEYTPEGVVITDRFRTQFFQSMCLLFVFIVFVLLGFAGIAMSLDPIQILIALVIIVTAIIIVMFVILRWIKGKQKIRKFSISDKSIELLVPPKAIFQVNWSDFNTIRIEREIKRYSDFQHSLVFDKLILNFLGTDFTQKFDFEIGMDFRKVNVEKILDLLKIYALKMNKEFIGLEKNESIWK